MVQAGSGCTAYQSYEGQIENKGGWLDGGKKGKGGFEDEVGNGICGDVGVEEED